MNERQPKLTAAALAGASEAVRRLNPHLFGLGAVEAGCAEPTPIRSLERVKPKRAKGAGGMAMRVQLIALRHRLLDPDAVAYSMKPLTDAVAETLGVDDADPRVHWEWSQAPTGGPEGVIVKITPLEAKEG